MSLPQHFATTVELLCAYSDCKLLAKIPFHLSSYGEGYSTRQDITNLKVSSFAHGTFDGPPTSFMVINKTADLQVVVTQTKVQTNYQLWVAVQVSDRLSTVMCSQESRPTVNGDLQASNRHRTRDMIYSNRD